MLLPSNKGGILARIRVVAFVWFGCIGTFL